MVDFVKFLNTADTWLKVKHGKSWPPPSDANVQVERLVSEGKCCLCVIDRAKKRVCPLAFTVGTFGGYEKGESNDSLNTRVSTGLSRDGRLEGRLEQHMRFSASLVHILPKAFDSSSGYSPCGLYIYLEGTVCVIDHTEIVEISRYEDSILLTFRYVSLRLYPCVVQKPAGVGHQRGGADNTTKQIYDRLMGSLLPGRFQEPVIEGWEDSSGSLDASISSSESLSHLRNVNKNVSESMQAASRVPGSQQNPTAEPQKNAAVEKSLSNERGAPSSSEDWYQVYLEKLERLSGLKPMRPECIDWGELPENEQTIELLKNKRLKLVQECGHAYFKHKQLSS